MHIQPQSGLRAHTGPPAEPALRKPFLTQPIALAVIAQDLQGPPASIRENEQRARDGISGELLATDRHQSIDALAKVHWLDRQQQAHLRGKLNHARCPQSPWARANAAAPSLWANRNVSL